MWACVKACMYTMKLIKRHSRSIVGASVPITVRSITRNSHTLDLAFATSTSMHRF